MSLAIAISKGAVIAQIAIAPDWTHRTVYGLAGALGIVANMLVHDQVLVRRKTAS